MKIAILQTDISWEDKQANLTRVRKLILANNSKPDIIILPETFNTGFTMDVKNMAETMDGQTISGLKQLASQTGSAICGSLIVIENDRYYNRLVFVEPSGKILTYDKRHLFGMGGEDKDFSRGQSRLVFNYLGLKISAIICYDLRFPVWSRNRADYDLLICTANWPESRIDVWSTLLKARALENQCFVAGANRIGTDKPGNHYTGGSVIIDPKGAILNSLPASGEGFVEANLDLESLNDFRKKFPAWKDADQFEIKVRG
ncbi:MAG: amidohydrolase [Bacteroidales bacterium]